MSAATLTAQSVSQSVELVDSDIRRGASKEGRREGRKEGRKARLRFFVRCDRRKRWHRSTPAAAGRAWLAGQDVFPRERHKRAKSAFISLCDGNTQRHTH